MLRRSFWLTPFGLMAANPHKNECANLGINEFQCWFGLWVNRFKSHQAGTLDAKELEYWLTTKDMWQNFKKAIDNYYGIS